MGDVLFGYLHPNEVPASFQKSMLDLIGYDLSGPRRLHSWAMVKCAPLGIAEGRNDLVRRFLGGPAEWLFMVDADMGFEPHTLDAMLSVAHKDKAPIIGGLAFAQREIQPDGFNGFRCQPNPTILEWRKCDDGHHRMVGLTHYPANSLVKANATGGAILLIHRSVFERIAEAGMDEPFTQIRDAGEGNLIGEDISFFMRTHQLDVPLFIHTGIRTTHFKHLWLAEEDFWQSFYAPPATEKVNVLIPVLSRPENVKPLVESLKASTGLATAHFICEPDDKVEQKAVWDAGGVVMVYDGAHTFAEKINRGYRDTDSPWVMLCGDDVRFRPGWLDQALEVARRYNGDVIGTNDLLNPRVTRGEHATHPLIRRSYIDERGASWDGKGVVCHEGYRHCFVDDEIVTVAKQRRVFQAALGSHVQHLHPIGGSAEMDPVYELGMSSFAADEAHFKDRLKKYG